jgi:hypothetical protein
MSKKHNKKRPVNFGKFDRGDEKPTLVVSVPDIVFSFKHICTGQHAPQQCSYPQLKSFNDKIRILCYLSWSSIDGSPRETNGYEIMPRAFLSRSVPSQVPTQSDILVFRFGGGSGSRNTGRIVGFKDGNTFHVLFVDSKLDLYDHGS